MEAQSIVRRKTPVRKVMLLVSLVAAIAALPPLAVATMSAVIPETVRGPLRFSAIEAPETVAPYEEFPVRITLAGEPMSPLTVNLQYAAYFGTVESGAVAMTPGPGRTYEASIPGFPDRTEVWFVAGITSGMREPMISESFSVRVGTLARGGASGLAISDVTHTVQSFGAEFRGPSGAPVTIEATVASRSPITHVDVAYMAFCSQQLSMPIDPEMTIAAPQRYTITITTPEPCTFAQSAILLYRVLAVDASGNTAVSDVFSVEMGFRTPQPFRAIP